MADRPDVLQRIAQWRADRVAIATAEDGGEHPNPRGWHDSDDTAVELLEELATLFDQTRTIDDPDGAMLFAALGVWTRAGVTFPLHPDENASDWWLLGNDSMHVAHPDLLREWADENVAEHEAECVGSPHETPTLDDCLAAAAGYRLMASIMDVWHAQNPPVT